MGKLVRDRTPEIICRNGGEPVTRRLGEEEILGALIAKLLEKAEELRAAQPHDQVEEATDVYEVLRAIATKLGVSIEDVVARADRIRAERGGFERYIGLKSW